MRRSTLFLATLLLAACGSSAGTGNAFNDCQAAVNRWAGEGIKATSAEIHHCELAADAGSVNAMLQLGVAYVKGEVVEQDVKEAVKWFELAAKAGDVNGQYNTGLAYLRGQGVAKDLARAAEFFKLAANQNDAGGQYNLGVMYATGEGLPKDPIKAYAWFDIAAQNGFEGAAEGRDEVAKVFTPEQLVQVKAASPDVTRRVKRESSSADEGGVGL